MSPNLKSAPQIWTLANDLGLKPASNPLSDIVSFCVKRIRAFLSEFPCNSLSDLLELAAAKLDTQFLEIRTDQDLQRIKQQFLQLGEFEFANLEEQLGPDVYAITFRRLSPSKDDRQFVSLIDCRGRKR